MNAITKAVGSYFDPFRDFARRQLGISVKKVDTALAHHATATINGRTVTLTYNDGKHDRTVNGHAGIGHTSHATEWVNQFNARSEEEM